MGIPDFKKYYYGTLDKDNRLALPQQKQRLGGSWKILAYSASTIFALVKPYKLSSINQKTPINKYDPTNIP